MRAPLKRYYLRSLLPMLAYTGLIVLALRMNESLQHAGLKITLALLPLLPLAWIFYYYFRYLAECDELERKIEMDAIAISAMSGVLCGMALLFLVDHALIVLSARTLIAIPLLALSAGYIITRYIGIWRFRA
jgi:hypothetical protein